MSASLPVQAAARHAVRKAIRRGTIERGECAHRNDVRVRGACGGPIEGHHEDHTKQLDVIWLCVMHHRRLHAARTWGNYEFVEETLA